VAALAAAALLLTYPLVRSFGSALPGNLGDPLMNAWSLGWGSQAFPGYEWIFERTSPHASDIAARAPRTFWDAPIFHPHEDTFAYSEHMLGVTLFVAPVYWLTGNAILTYNVAFIGSFVLAGVGMFLLVHAITGRRDVALVIALAFAFSPLRVGAQSARLQMLMSGWLPLALWAIHRYGATRAGRYLVWLIASTTLMVLSNMYMLLIGALPIALAALFELARAGRERWRLAGGFALAAGAILLVLGPIVVKYRDVQASMGFARGDAEIVQYSATLRSYLSAFETQGWLPWVHVDKTADRALYVGAALLLLAGIGSLGALTLFLRRRGRVEAQGAHETESAVRSPAAAFLVLYAVVTGLAIALSFGPVLHGWNGELLGAGPYAWLRRLVPAIDGLRAPGRFGLVVSVGLSVIAAYGAALLLKRATAFRRAAVLTGVVGLVIVEAWPAQFVVAPFAARGRAIDEPLYAFLATQPPGSLVELPASRSAARAGDGVLVYQFATLTHAHELVNGLSGFNSPLADLLEGESSPFLHLDRVSDGVAMLQAVGVRYVAVHVNDYVDPEHASEVVSALRVSPAVRAHHVFGSNHLFEIDARSQPSPLPARPPYPRIDVAAHHLVTSHGQAESHRVLDGRSGSFWSSGRPAAEAWLRVQFDTPHDVRHVRLEMGAKRDTYPRTITIVGRTEDGRDHELYSGPALPPLAVGMVDEPRTAPIALALPPNRTSRLTIIAGDAGHRKGWSIDELQIYGEESE
jgi:hypothetical protein